VERGAVLENKYLSKLVFAKTADKNGVTTFSKTAHNITAHNIIIMSLVVELLNNQI
jgi:hypothetical protein